MTDSNRLLEYYLPPAEGFVLESLIATTYHIDFEFFEEELLPVALGVRSPVSRMRAFRSELERQLQRTDVTVLFDLAGCERLARLSPRVDPIPIASRKLHAKISLLMWSRSEAGSRTAVERRLRLIVGSANLTRPGFRENYECVAAVDYGSSPAPPILLVDALALLRDVARDTHSRQLESQLDQFERVAAGLPTDSIGNDAPDRLVRANQVVGALRDVWHTLSTSPPRRAVIVSPFWPEGATAAESLADLCEQLGSPGELTFVCRGRPSSAGGTWLPEFDGTTARELRRRLGRRILLQPARPDYGIDPKEAADADDETEDRELADRLKRTAAAAPAVSRDLHAKVIVLDGPEGAALYIGSSNCTRRGLGLGGPVNWEAGLVYRLDRRQRRLVERLVDFAGQPIEISPEEPPQTASPEPKAQQPVPSFLAEIVVVDTRVTIRFRPGQIIPHDLVILMEDPASGENRVCWLLMWRDEEQEVRDENSVDLKQCPRCGLDLTPAEPLDEGQRIVPHIQVEVRWDGNAAVYPARFDDKNGLPLVLLGRKPTEGELIDYFVFGREPDLGLTGDTDAGHGGQGPLSDQAIDTRGILAYFVRRFVQAIPGIEVEITQAAYSRRALDAALRGPTSPLALAEQAYASLKRPPGPDEPRKTATAVAFQLVEILAAVQRSRDRLDDDELRAVFRPVIDRCRELLDRLAADHAELRHESFALYRTALLEGAV